MKDKVRRSVYAGTEWYPGDEGELRKTIEEYFSNADTVTIPGDIVGLISPHAGYYFSGQTAAYGYKQIMGKSYDFVVVLAPLHRPMTDRYIVNDSEYYETPLGKIPIAKEMIDQLKSSVELTFIGQDGEHSLEIQLPFLQVALKKFQLLPILLDPRDFSEHTNLIDSLARIVGKHRTLLVASTDLHHENDYFDVERMDKAIVDILVDFDYQRIHDALSRPGCSVCGGVPVSIAVDVSKKLGADKLIVLHQTNSGEVTKQKRVGQWTVGYLSAAIVKS